MRRQTEERRGFTYAERLQICEKSDNKCCHCGKGVKMHDKESTIEHIIPISKGGTNDFRNLVYLCTDCNEKKANLIIPPYDYYQYLKEEYHDEVIKLYTDYCNDITYYDKNNFTKDDAKIFTYYNRFSSCESFVPKSKRKRASLGVSLLMKATLTKAFYSDLDEIYEYCLKYHKKHNIPSDGLKAIISDTFNEGAFYIVRKGSEIVAIIPVSPGLLIDKNDESKYLISINGIPNLYKRDCYIPLITDCINYIVSEISKIDSDGNVVFKIMSPVNDSFANRIAIGLKPLFNHETDDGVWNSYGYIHTYVKEILNYDGDDKLNIYRQLKEGETMDEMKVICNFSKSLQRVFGLKPLTEEKDKKETIKEYRQNTKTKKKKARQKNISRYDEDDYEYLYS